MTVEVRKVGKIWIPKRRKRSTISEQFYRCREGEHIEFAKPFRGEWEVWIVGKEGYYK